MVPVGLSVLTGGFSGLGARWTNPAPAGLSSCVTARLPA
jgi:hypothetical protein